MTEEKKQTSFWTKKQKLFLNICAVLGLINMIAYFVIQSSFVMQNLYWVYGIFTLCDGIGFFMCWVFWDEHETRHFKEPLPGRFKTVFSLTGLWLISIPIVIIQYYFPVIGLSMILNVLWSVSLIVSGFYDALYLFVIIGVWATKGMDLN